MFNIPIGRHLAHLYFMLRHKYYVLLEGVRFGAPLIELLCHDWDKFLPEAWMAYANACYAPDGKRHFTDSERYRKAKECHEQRNKHHWQYWYENGYPHRIPEFTLREMLADWFAAGRYWSGKQWQPDEPLLYFLSNHHSIHMHPVSKAFIKAELLRCAEPYITEGFNE